MSALSNIDTWKEYVENNCGVKQPVNLNEVIDPLDDVDEITEIETERENTPRTNLVREASTAANVIVITYDLLLSRVAGMWSGDDYEQFKLKSDEKDYYQDAWANYLAEKNIEMSPGLMLIVATLLLTIPRLIDANKIRKEKKQQETQENIINEQDTEIKHLKKKLNERKSSEV
ncbi:MAG: hypothetical protein LBI45_00610 [Bacteroidales bacterium]|jgi:hypothetical protein|nr:hypothetical protein [Bacteroidales bacterium]